MDKILSLQELRVDLLSEDGEIHAVRGVNLELGKGEIHGIVGESGCGKTVMAKSVLRLHDRQRTHYAGRVLFGAETDILTMDKKMLRRLRGKEISMVFQNPLNALNPLLPVGEQIAEVLTTHCRISRTQAMREAISLLEQVGIHPAEQRARQYPFEFSGGMLQRAVIAAAIACRPKLLIADEPTTALDVTVQAQILELLRELSAQNEMSILLITHNLGVVAEICSRVSVMYAGQIVESGAVSQIFHNPRHPYTKALLDNRPVAGKDGGRLHVIQGNPPNLLEDLPGCAFRPRCPYAGQLCGEGKKVVWEETGHFATCTAARA